MHQEQMSRVTTQIEHHNRIKNNLLTIEKEKDEEIKQNYNRLKSKFQGYDKKRQLKHQQKAKGLKLNQEKWNRKIQDIERRFRSQNRQAMEKAEKYRQQSQDFWKNKETQAVSARGTSYQRFNMNKTEKTLTKNGYDYLLNNSTHLDKNSIDKKSIGKRNKYLQFKLETLQGNGNNNLESSRMLHPESSRGELKNSLTIDIREDIVRHKEKSQQIQKQKEAIVFQNAMKRLAKIEETRKKAQQLKEPSKSPVEIRRPKKQSDEQEDNFYKNVNSAHKKSSSIQASKSKQSLLNDSIQNHIVAKKRIQQKQFMERQKLAQSEHKRKKQDKILKLIKNKIKDIKSSTIKMQSLQ